MTRLGVLAGLLLAFVAASAPRWTTTVTLAPTGGYVMGNPKAKVRLVEYLSYTCGHCAHFVAESSAPLKQSYVARGTVSIEFRNAVRDQFDLTAALAARCGGPTKFFGNSEAILAAQQAWIVKAQNYQASNAEKLQAMEINDALKVLARALGLDTLLKSRGISAQQLDACLVDANAQKAVVGMTRDAFEVRQIQGTPSFLINGQLLQGPHDWRALELKLKAAAAAK